MREPLPEWPLFGMTDDVRPALSPSLAGKACRPGHPDLGRRGRAAPAGDPDGFADGIVSGYFPAAAWRATSPITPSACLEDGGAPAAGLWRGQPWPDIQLLCGARIEIFVERVAADDPALAELLKAQEERRPVVWVSDGDSASASAGRPSPGTAPSSSASIRPRAWWCSGPIPPRWPSRRSARSRVRDHARSSQGAEAPPPLPGVAYRRDEPQAA